VDEMTRDEVWQLGRCEYVAQLFQIRVCEYANDSGNRRDAKRQSKNSPSHSRPAHLLRAVAKVPQGRG
jgi:hypothetical protein